MRYWLMKSEPQTFSIEDLRGAPNGQDCWDGVRNYQARNFMREMVLEDRVLFYHSACAVPAVVGTAYVARTAYPDHTAWDAQDAHYDPRSTPAAPRWWMVDLRFEASFPCPLPLAHLRTLPALSGMLLLRKGMRLSVMPVSAEEFRLVLEQGEALARAEGHPWPPAGLSQQQ